jgi:hypothetical protein
MANIIPNVPSNLNPTQLGSLTSSIPSLPRNLPTTGSLKDQAEKLKDLAGEKLANALPVDPKEIIKVVGKKSDKTSAEIKRDLLLIATPLLLRFITSEAVINRLISAAVKAATKALNQKGRVSIQGLSITFTPIQPGNYDIIKQNFDKKVDSLKKAVNALKKTVDTISTILTIVTAAISAIKVIRAIIKKKKQIQAKLASAELALPSPIKPTFSTYMATKEEDDDREKDLDKKLESYSEVLTILTGTLLVFRGIINKIQAKLNEVNLTINNPQPTAPSTQPLSEVYNTTPGKDSEMSETYQNTFGSYILKVESLPSGTIQAVAYDKFSNLKITQTAPSRLKAADKLLDELKQILG